VAAGTFATYQGFPLRACQFRRSRGYAATTSTVDIMASSLPAGWSVEAPNLSTLFTKARNQSEPKRVANGFAASGALVMRYTDEKGVDYKVTVDPLYIIRAETVRRGPSVERVRLTLVDIRYFWPRGLMNRWSFNRRRGDGVVAMDSTIGNEDVAVVGGSPGDLFSRFQIAQLATKRLAGAPRLVSAPERWKLDKSGVEFKPFAPAVSAVQQLVAKAGLEDPCLRLDGDVDLPAAGAGALGYAPGGTGENKQAFESKFKLYKDGQGQGRVVEPGYPEEFVVVVGGQRVATVALDDWEPVLYLPGRVVVPLNEETVRKLTGNRYGMEWLSEFVLRPPNYRSDPNVDPEVTDLLGDQAWRLWRMPGVEAGPNAHLLPMQPRAETENGRRVAITVEIVHFTTEHVTLRASPNLERLSEIGRQMAALRANKPAIPSSVTVVGGHGLGTLSVLDLLSSEAQKELSDLGISSMEIDQALKSVRAIEAARKAVRGGDLYADNMLRLERERLEEEEKAGRGRPGQVAIFDAALEVVKAEKELEKGASAVLEALGKIDSALSDQTFRTLLKERSDLRELVGIRIKDLAKRAANARAQARQRFLETGSEAVSKPRTHVLYSNRPKPRAGGVTRKIDQDAIVVDEHAGVIRTSELAGHVEPDGAPATTLGAAKFVPKPVRVIFGTSLRPRVDVPPGTTSRPESGAGSIPGRGGQNVVPEALNDTESTYYAAFGRVARGVPIRIGLNEDVFARGVVIDDPDLVELIRLDGSSNLLDLDQRATELAADRLNAPDVVESSRVLLAHPWPVNCDGVVESVTITMREKDGAPCGFETLVTTGSSRAAVPQGQGQTRTRTAAQIAAAKGAAAKREGTAP
jgi:hypothetical protein